MWYLLHFYVKEVKVEELNPEYSPKWRATVAHERCLQVHSTPIHYVKKGDPKDIYKDLSNISD
jgi:hypothetical protein